VPSRRGCFREPGGLPQSIKVGPHGHVVSSDRPPILDLTAVDDAHRINTRAIRRGRSWATRLRDPLLRREPSSRPLRGWCPAGFVLSEWDFCPEPKRSLGYHQCTGPAPPGRRPHRTIATSTHRYIGPGAHGRLARLLVSRCGSGALGAVLDERTDSKTRPGVALGPGTGRFLDFLGACPDASEPCHLPSKARGG
jgi:hypothetical protein